MGRRIPNHLVRSHKRKRAFKTKKEVIAEANRLNKSTSVRLTYYKCRVGTMDGAPGHYHLRNRIPRRYR